MKQAQPLSLREVSLREALLPLVGPQGYQRVLAAMYHPEVLRVTAPNVATRQHIVRTVAAHGHEALPRQETVLESDSKSRIYVIRICGHGVEPLTMVLKWYEGSRQPQAAIEASMNTYFRQCLAQHSSVVPILAVVPVSATAQSPLSLSIMPYCGNETLYDRLHTIPRHSSQVTALLAQASETLAHIQVLGRQGHDKQTIHLADLTPDGAASYFLKQIDSALLPTFATSGLPGPMAKVLLEQFAAFAAILAGDSTAAGLYYRGINPRNIMLVGEKQVEIDFEQDSLRSRFIDIVSLLENGLEMTDWDISVDYHAFTGQLPFATWQQQRQRAEAALAVQNYLSHEQVNTLTTTFLETTWRLEQKHLAAVPPPYGPVEQRLLLDTTRLFRHLQYVGYCKRNEEQAQTASKRLSSRCRQHFHAVWAKVALDNLLFPSDAEAQCLSEAQRHSALALRHTLDQLPLPALETV